MNYIQDNLETLVYHLQQIDPNAKPLWGTMIPQRMVEHLTGSILSGFGQIEMTCPYEGEKLARSKAFLMSDAPMPREFKAHFVDDEAPLQYEEFDLAVDAFIEAWVDFEEYCETHPEAKHVHPVFGELALPEWRWMHRKHITHHFTQFGVKIEVLEDSEDN